MAIRLIYNPVAGAGRARAVLDRLSPRLAQVQDLELIATRERGHAEELARAVRDRPGQLVISMGGDGTHHEVANGLLPDGTAELGVIPAGSGNDFAFGLGLPRDPLRALDVALTGVATPMDVGRVNDQYFLTVVGAGFDAEVAGYINSRPHSGRGQWIYLNAILRMLLRYRCEPLNVEVNGVRRSRSTLLLACGNTARYGGGIRICPTANPHDGLLEVVWVGGLSRLRILPLLVRAYGGTHVLNPVVETFAADHLHVDGPPGYHVHADGELVGTLPVEIGVLHEALRVRLPEAPR
jgi:YegS/Rv2252/BmrU family lipid kinase